MRQAYNYTFGAVPNPALAGNAWGMGKKKPGNQPTFIREWRKYRGLSQVKLSDRLDLTQETLSRIETGKIAYTQPVLEAIANALDCTPADLIMKNPLDPQAIWSIWDQIPATQRDQAARVLEAFIKKTGT